MFGIKMPWTRRREAREAQEKYQKQCFEEMQRLIVEKRERARNRWANQQPVTPIPVHQVATSSYVSSAPIEPMLINSHTHYEHPAPGVQLMGHGGTFDGGGATGNWVAAAPACDAGSGNDTSSSDATCSSSD